MPNLKASPALSPVISSPRDGCSGGTGHLFRLLPQPETSGSVLLRNGAFSKNPSVDHPGLGLGLPLGLRCYRMALD